MPLRANYEVTNIASISYEDGAFISGALKKGKTVNIQYAFFPGTFLPNKMTGGELSDTTSWGPTPDVGLWPQLVAPGDPLFTTYALNYGSYINIGGTAAAQAYLTGVAALYYQKHGGRKALGSSAAAALLEKMQTTSNPTTWVDGTGEEILTPFKRSV